MIIIKINFNLICCKKDNYLSILSMKNNMKLLFFVEAVEDHIARNAQKHYGVFHSAD